MNKKHFSGLLWMKDKAVMRWGTKEDCPEIMLYGKTGGVIVLARQDDGEDVFTMFSKSLKDGTSDLIGYVKRNKFHHTGGGE